ncbi:MAG: FAD-dependent oxidoreductase [Proteocatella sp.]
MKAITKKILLIVLSIIITGASTGLNAQMYSYAEEISSREIKDGISNLNEEKPQVKTGTSESKEETKKQAVDETAKEKKLTRQSSYDVVVFGSDPEGVAAAASASKRGLSTLLVDYNRSKVGGLYTLGWLNMIDFNYAPDKTDAIFDTRFYPENYLNHGIFNKFYKLIGKKKAFDVPKAQKAFEEILSDEKVEVIFLDNDIIDYRYDSKTRISNIVLNRDKKPEAITAKIVIDCTPNADIAIKAGAKFLEGKEDLGLKNRYQATTLVFKIDQVNWNVISNHLKYDADCKTGANGTSAWGYDEMFKCPVDNPKMQMRGLNLGLQEDGSVLINAFQIFDMNPYDKNKDEEIRKEAKKRIEQDVIPYMRKQLKGFEDARLVDVAPEFYIRETRHLVGEEKLTANNIFDNVFPKNFIASGSYPIDIQAKKKGDSGTVLSGTKPYGITAGMLIPKGIDGIFVASKCASFDSVAFGSARTVPVLMSMGEAAGVMAKVIIDENTVTGKIVGNQKMLLRTRNLLFDQGVRLVAYPNSNPTEDSYAKDQMKFLRGKALISMGYGNDYKLEEPASYEVLSSMLYLVENNSKYKITKDVVSHIDNGDDIDVQDMIIMANKILGKKMTTLEDMKASYVINDMTYKAIKSKSEITNEDMYAIMAGIVSKAPIYKV